MIVFVIANNCDRRLAPPVAPEIEVKITLTKHGGFAAGIFRPPYTVDSSGLREVDVKELSALVAAVKASPKVEEVGPGRARDAMSYTILVEENGKEIVFRQSDTNMAPAFEDLLHWLELRAQEK